ncbi:MAG: DUF748 domain-containing protein [Planctomycetota bacterium]|jgi:uncharacterized protein involved in outer membrane biogenesis
MKRLKIIALLVLVLIIVVIVTIPLWIDGAARSVIESEGSKALGVELTLEKLSLSLFGGEAKLGDMKIANPEGYTDDQFFGLGAGHASVSYGSLGEDTIVIPEIVFEDVNVSLEKDGGKGNYDVLIENLEKYAGEGEEEETTEGKKFVIKKISVRNITVTSRMRALVVGGLLAGIANSGISLAGDIGKGLGNATLSIGKDGVKVVGEGGKAVTDVVEGIGGLIPKKKKK